MSEKPFGIDISSWQGEMDWKVVANHTPRVEFIIIRGGCGGYFADPRFAANWAGAKSIGRLRGVYIYMYPDQSVAVHMENLFKLFPSGYDGEIPITLDYEADKGMSKQAILDHITQCAKVVKSRTGRDPLLYSRASWIHAFTPPGDWRNKFYWWLANYVLTKDSDGVFTIEHPGPPLIPKGMNKAMVAIHQTGDHTKAIGAAGSRMMDYNRWLLGDVESLYKFANMKPPVVEQPPVIEPTMEEKVDKLWKAHPELH